MIAAVGCFSLSSLPRRGIEPFDSQRAGMATILVFLVAGLAVLLPLPDPDRA